VIRKALRENDVTEKMKRAMATGRRTGKLYSGKKRLTLDFGQAVCEVGGSERGKTVPRKERGGLLNRKRGVCAEETRHRTKTHQGLE